MDNGEKSISYSRLAVLKQVKEFEEKRIGAMTELILEMFSEKLQLDRREIDYRYGEYRNQRSRQEIQARFPRFPKDEDIEFILKTLVDANFLTKDGTRYTYRHTNMY